ncbi:MAG: hypothetical protein KBD94_01835 [Pyrinomonadaceae bacterium]|nr:hypothetical protein [Pyrinomonadaceae bacterium]
MEHALNLLKNYFAQDRSTVSRATTVKDDKLTTPRSISINPNSVFRTLVVLAGLVLLVSLGSELGNIWNATDSRVFPKLVKAFSVDRELNIPAFFSTMLLLISSGLLACIAFLSYDGRLSSLRYWGVLALGFFWMAFDEMASVHEKLIEPMRVLLGGENLGVFYFAWVVPGIIVVLLCAGWFFRFWLGLPFKTRIQFFVAGALFLSGAVGMELLDGDYAEVHGKITPTYAVLSTIEEMLEMAGVIVFIKALLGYIADRFHRVELRFGANEQREAK